MAENDAVHGRVTIHAGTRYAGMAQKVDDYRQAPDDDTLIERAKKFVNKKEPPVLTDKSPPKTVSIENIHWITKRKKIEMMVNCSRLVDIVKKLTTGRSSIFNPLYIVVRGALINANLPPVAHFCIIATGADPQHEKGIGTFIKVKINNEEFVLPNSFLRDCSDAFLKKPSL